MENAPAIDIKQLKQQVLKIQMQSLNILRQSAYSYFKAHTTEANEQIVSQELELQQNIKEANQAIGEGGDSQENESVTEVKNDDGQQIPTPYKPAVYAMQAANQSVRNAVQAANQSVKNAENVLKNIG